MRTLIRLDHEVAFLIIFSKSPTREPSTVKTERKIFEIPKGNRFLFFTKVCTMTGVKDSQKVAKMTFFERRVAQVFAYGCCDAFTIDGNPNIRFNVSSDEVLAQVSRQIVHSSYFYPGP